MTCYFMIVTTQDTPIETDEECYNELMLLNSPIIICFWKLKQLINQKRTAAELGEDPLFKQRIDELRKRNPEVLAPLDKLKMLINEPHRPHKQTH